MEAILERREEDFIIESELDFEKVPDFTDSYVSGFEEQFMFRQILKDLGWLEVQQYDGETEGFGYNVRYPKTAFISTSRIVHDIDRRTQNHANSILDRWLTQAEGSLSEIEVQSHDLLLDEVIEFCTQLDRQGKSHELYLSADSDQLTVLHKANTLLRASAPMMMISAGSTTVILIRFRFTVIQLRTSMC